jgi:histone deacetylase 1/2
LPTPVLNGTSPFEILYGKSPLYTTFWIFGCLCFLNLLDYTKHKFEPRSLPCIFLGYHTSYKGFWLNQLVPRPPATNVVGSK